MAEKVGNIEFKTSNYDDIKEFIVERRVEMVDLPKSEVEKISRRVETIKLHGIVTDNIRIYLLDKGMMFASVEFTAHGELNDMRSLIHLGEAVLHAMGLKVLARAGELLINTRTKTMFFKGLYQVRGKLKPEIKRIVEGEKWEKEKEERVHHRGWR